MTTSEYYRMKLESLKKLSNNQKNYKDDMFTFHGDYVQPTVKISSGIIRSFVDTINNLE